jgi:PIF1-like helicase
MRRKARNDPTFCQRLLDYIGQVVDECLPEDPNPIDEEDDDDTRLFQPYTKPDDPNFHKVMPRTLTKTVHYRQMHRRKHMPTCFKYGSRKCRSRFPRKIVLVTFFDKDTGVFHIKRNHRWVNNYNKWIAQMTRGNHDVQFLFNKTHALAIIHYVMKYITKPEVALHSKLTIAAAVRQALVGSPSTDDVGKKMLLKIYNKLEAYREVGVPEAISHMLGYPDHYTDATFWNLNTTHLLSYTKSLHNARIQRTQQPSDISPDSEIIVDDKGGYSLVSMFDDYANRGEGLSQYCLYDYCSLVYKRKNPGISFESDHPQHLSQHQIVRETSAAIPTLLGKLLFMNKGSEKAAEREDCYCILTSLFFPWSSSQPIETASWEEFFHSNSAALNSRLQWYIHNIDLLHKTKEEDRLNRLQLKAQEAEPGNDSDDDSVISHVDHMMELDFEDESDDDAIPHSSIVDETIETLTDLDGDYYVREGVDASETQGYLNPSPGHSPNRSHKAAKIHYSLLESNEVFDSLASVSKATFALQSDPTPVNPPPPRRTREVQPTVYLTDGTEDDAAINLIVHQFSLNTEQERAFRLIANHSLGKGNFDEQLLMGLFGEAGTGKSRVVDAIRTWFAARNRSKELIVTATTGTAAFNIRGTTLHSALGLAIEPGHKHRPMSWAKKKEWRSRRYIIIDEVSMLDCKLIIKLHNKLCSAKSSKQQVKFGGLNILFLGDFLQLPSCSKSYLYVLNPPYQLGHHLWRSLNAVVILREQMRQAGDQRWADLLHRLWLRQPTQEDIDLLISRIGAQLPDSAPVTIIVRRNELRHALNLRRLHHLARSRHTPVVYSIAKVVSRERVSRHKTYRLRVGHNNVKGDVVLPLIPGAPLMITKNIDKPLGKLPFYISYSLIH